MLEDSLSHTTLNMQSEVQKRASDIAKTGINTEEAKCNHVSMPHNNQHSLNGNHLGEAEIFGHGVQ